MCLYPLYGSLPRPSQAPEFHPNVGWDPFSDPPAAPLTPHPPPFDPVGTPPWRLAADKVMEQCRVVMEAEQDKLVAAVFAQSAVPMGTRK